MGYRLVTGLYVANYICLAPELLLTDYGSRSAMGSAFCRTGRRVGVRFLHRQSFLCPPSRRMFWMNTDVRVRRCVMGYRLVTGLYVTNYICLAPELLMTDYGSR